MSRIVTVPAPAPAPRPPALLEVRDLRVSFELAAGRQVQAVNGASLTVHEGQTVALVGESGCGKSVTALTTLQLIPRPPGHIDGGHINFAGRDLLRLTERDMLEVRGREIAMIFQEPMTSLNPVYTIGAQIIEAVRRHQKLRPRAAREVAIQALGEVGITEAEQRLHRFPHEFSGGMLQRVMIAMALVCRPRLLLADEPTTALDVTIQAQILDLLRAIQRDRGMAILLITHDLCVVAQYADVVCVMYDGKVVEYAGVYELFERPMHPYTRALLGAIPELHASRRRLATVTDVVSDHEAFARLPGHSYGVVPWWPEATPPERVDEAAPSVLHEIEPDHWVACWRTPYLADLPLRVPDLHFSRDEAGAGVSQES